MTLRNEIFEGIAAMKGTQEAFGGTPRDRYYNELYKAARRENDDFEARRVARQKAIAAGRPNSSPTPIVPRVASSGNPVVQQAFTPAAFPAQDLSGGVLNLTETYQQGGMVRRPFDPEGDGYDDETAEWEGVRPEMNPEDGKMHGMSRVPRTGLQLKGRKHPTWDKAIETDRRLGYGLEMRDGRYYTQKFADGGAVLRQKQREHLTEHTAALRGQGGSPGEPEAGEHNDADLIVMQLLENQPPQQTSVGAAGDNRARTRTAALGLEAQVPLPEEPPPVALRTINDQVGPPNAPPDPSTRINVRGAGDRARMATAMRSVPLPQDTPSPTYDPRTDFQRRVDESNPLGRTLVDDVRSILPEAQSAEEAARAQAAARGVTLSEPTEALDTRAYGRAARPAFDPGETGGIPVTGGQTPSASPYGPAGPAPAGDPDNIGQMSLVPRRATTLPNQTPANGAAVTPQGARVSGQTNGPPVSNPQSGPTGTAGDRAPPVGGSAANTPTGAPKTGQGDGMAPGPGGSRVPRGSLRDQTRTAAFDPVADFNDPARVPAAAPMSAYTPQDYAQVMQGVASVAKEGPVGQGAVTRQNFQNYTQRNNQGGKFTPGEAMLVGMLSDYKMLLSQGRVQQANMMAYGLIQAASLEAASYGMVAQDALRSGDSVTALNNAVEALNYLPDGKTFKAGPDGRTIVAFDAQTGRQTGSAQVTPQQLLALITGVSDGSLLWNALQSSAAGLAKPDRNAEGRALTNTLRREQIEGARLRNAKLRSGGGGGGRATPGFSDPGARLNALLSGAQPRTSGGGAPRPQGDDTSYVDVETQDPPDE